MGTETWLHFQAAKAVDVMFCLPGFPMTPPSLLPGQVDYSALAAVG